MNTLVYKSLCEKRHRQLEHTGEKKSEENLQEISAIAIEIAGDESQGAARAGLRILHTAKLISGCESHGNSERCAIAFARGPMAHKLLKGIRRHPLSGVGDMESGAMAGYFVEHHKMILVPMYDSRQRHLPQRIDTRLISSCLQSDSLGSVGYAEQRYPFGCGCASLGEKGQRISHTQAGRHHGQARNTTLHSILLMHIILASELHIEKREKINLVSICVAT